MIRNIIDNVSSILDSLETFSPRTLTNPIQALLHQILMPTVLCSAISISIIWPTPQQFWIFVFSLIILLISIYGSRHSLGTLIITFTFVSLFFLYNPLTNSQLNLITTNSQTFNLIIITLNLFITGLILIFSLNLMHPRNFIISVSTLILVINLFFLTNSLLSFYILFELSLIPTIYIIMNWGYQPERLIATIYFTIYTICASLPLLMVILNLRWNKGIIELNPLINNFPEPHEISTLTLICFLMAFLANLPTWGIHLWLPKAHLQAPLAGSIILAGVLLNLGGYGIINITIILSNIKSITWSLIFTINLYGSLLVGLICLSTIDINNIIAYSSIIHINLIILGITTITTTGTIGANIIIIAHGISSPGIFSMANVNYENSNTRNLTFNNIFLSQPPMMFIWFVLCSSNIAAPPSLSLISEILITTSVINNSIMIIIPLGIITFLSAAYNLYLYSSQLTNNPQIRPNNRNDFSVEFLGATAQSLPPFLLISTIFMF